MDNYSKFIAASRYARWQDDKSRRETWEETAQRYVAYWGNKKDH
jgi:ribonucleoside-diphosphate reductase alpha chain